MIGGGDVALEDAIFLARLCEKVYVIHRRDEFRGAKSLQKRLMELPNVEILWDTVPEEIVGTDKVETLRILNKKTGEKNDLAVDGVFVAVGITPNSEIFRGSVEMGSGGIYRSRRGRKDKCSGNFRGRGCPYKGAPPDRDGGGGRRELRRIGGSLSERAELSISTAFDRMQN